jgi:hypothetical protein
MVYLLRAFAGKQNRQFEPFGFAVIGNPKLPFSRREDFTESTFVASRKLRRLKVAFRTGKIARTQAARGGTCPLFPIHFVICQSKD